MNPNSFNNFFTISKSFIISSDLCESEPIVIISPPNFLYLFENKDIDFIIGSSHAISGKDVATKDFFLGKEKNEAHREYFLEVLKNIDLFPEISVYGHLDF